MSKCILLVDDEQTILHFCRLALEAEGYTILEAHDGDEAVQIYTNTHPKPDLVLMDYRMPRKNGLIATAEIKTYDPTAKIIFSTADDSIKPQAQNLGIIDFKKKPFGLDCLITNISDALTPIPSI